MLLRRFYISENVTGKSARVFSACASFRADTPMFCSPETEKEVKPHPQDRNSRSPLLTRLVSLSVLNTRHVRLPTRRYIPSPHLARWIHTTSACTDGLSLWQSRGGRFSASPPAALLVRPGNTENSLTHERGSSLYGTDCGVRL